MSGPAPNWYPDPSGEHGLRYWDGVRWTSQVTDAPQRIECTKCGREVSGEPASCPHCGFPFAPPVDSASSIDPPPQTEVWQAASRNVSSENGSPKARLSLGQMLRQSWNSLSKPVQGLLITGVAVAVIIAISFGDTQSSTENSTADTDRTTVAVAAAETMEWSIVVGENTILLTGELPNGFPTETWLNNELLDRDLGGDFSWDLDKQVPQPVSPQDDMGCDQLQSDIDFWLRGVTSSLDQDQLGGAARQSAYAQNAINLQVENGC